MREIYAESWLHLKELLTEKYAGKLGFVFRGHADKDWSLESTLSRLSKRISSDIPPETITKNQLEVFRRKIRGLRGENPKELRDFELWALGQHYGLCTPLLDWSESPYIAAYFAFENAKDCSGDYRSIYALDQGEILKEMNKDKHKFKDFQFINPLTDDNKRITAQSGLFTKLPIETSLEKFLQSREMDNVLCKFNIEDFYRLDVLNDLKLMNITASSIYPDLIGAAKDCNMLIENVSDNHEVEKDVRAFLDEAKFDG